MTDRYQQLQQQMRNRVAGMDPRTLATVRERLAKTKAERAAKRSK